MGGVAVSRFAVLVVAAVAAGCSGSHGLDFGCGLDVPYVQTPPHVVTAMLRMAGAGPGDVVLDLGCGDGRIPIAAAREFGAEGLGYDLDPERIAEARENALIAGVGGQVRFFQENLFRAPLERASVITMFLMPNVLEELRPRLLRELSSGTRIVSHSFPLRAWPVERKVVVEGRTLYLYRAGRGVDEGP